MQTKLLIIMNPVAGTKKPNKHLDEIIALFCQNDCNVQIQMTSKTVGADKLVEMYAKDKDVVVCIGGDGTFNETVSGLVKCEYRPLLGYIPSGSTNDFANGLGISKTPMTAAKDIFEGTARDLDAGLFNGRVFIYTASFGIFTKTSYSTPRDLKNVLGYLAYVLEGTKEIVSIPSYHLKVTSQNTTIEGNYIFGAVCNTKQIGGGLVKFNENEIDMNDGLLEVLLVKYPKNPADVAKIMIDAQSGKFDSSMFDFFSARDLTIQTEDDIIWTLDGEYQKGSESIYIKNLKSAIPLILKDRKKKSI